MEFAEPKQTYDSVWNWINHDVNVAHGKWPIKDKGRGPFGHVTHIFSSTTKIAYMYWLLYDSTRDKEFLLERAYPVLKGVAEFYRNFPNLKKDADGRYHIYHVNNFEARWDSTDTQEELSGMRSITPLAIRASEILGVDAEMRAVWHEFLANMAPLPTNESVQKRQPGGGPIIREHTRHARIGPDMTQMDRRHFQALDYADDIRVFQPGDDPLPRPVVQPRGGFVAQVEILKKKGPGVVLPDKFGHAQKDAPAVGAGGFHQQGNAGAPGRHDKSFHCVYWLSDVDSNHE